MFRSGLFYRSLKVLNRSSTIALAHASGLLARSKKTASAMALQIQSAPLSWKLVTLASALLAIYSAFSGLSGTAAAHHSLAIIGLLPWRYGNYSIRGYPKKDEQTLNQIRSSLQELQANYGFLPEDDRVITYVDQLMDQLLPGTSLDERPIIHVLARQGKGINAWVYPDGSIVITPELLAKCEFKEEIQAVLAHEIMHLDREHFGRHVVETERLRAIRRSEGLSRYAEYEADAAAFFLMANVGINVQGTIAVRKKLNGDGWDAAHGSGSDLLLNLQSITYFADIANLSRTLTPLPKGFRRVFKRLPKRGILETILSDKPADQEEAHELIRTAGWPLINLLYQTKSSRIGLGEHNIKLLKLRFEELFQSTFQDLPTDDQAIARALLTLTITSPKEGLDQFRDFEPACLGPDFIQQFPRLLEVILDRVDLYFDVDEFDIFLKDIFDVRRKELAYNISKGVGQGFDYRAYLRDAVRVARLSLPAIRRHALGIYSPNVFLTDLTVSALEELSLNNQISNESLIHAFFLNVKKIGITQIDPIAIDSRLRVTHIGSLDVRACVRIMRYVGLVPRPLQEEMNDRYFDVKRTVSDLITNSSHKPLDLEIATRWAYETYSADDMLHAMNDMLQQIRKHHWDIHRYTKVYELLQTSILTHHLYYDTTPDEIREIINFFQLCSPTEWHYRTAIRDLGERLFYLSAHPHPQRPLQMNLSYDVAKSLPSWINDFKATESRYGLLSGVDPLPLDLNDQEDFQFLAFKGLVQRLRTVDSPDEFFTLLDTYLQNWRLIPLWGPQDNRIYDALNVIRDGMNGIQEKGRRFLQGADGAAGTESRKMTLSFFETDFFARKQLQEELILRSIKTLSFSDAFETVFEKYRVNRPEGLSQAINYLIEEKAETPSEFEHLMQKIPSLLSWEDTSLQSSLGALVIADGFIENLFSDKQEMLQHLLTTRDGDQAFRDFLFERWIKIYQVQMQFTSIGGIIEDAVRDATDKALFTASIDDPTKSKTEIVRESIVEALETWSSKVPPILTFTRQDEMTYAFYYPLQEVLNTFYRMDAVGRIVLLRKLLMSPNDGALVTPKGRQRLINDFLNVHLDESQDASVSSLLRQIVAAVTRVASEDRLYFALNGLLKDRVAIRPDTPGSWDARTQSAAGEAYRYITKKFKGEVGDVKKLIVKYKAEVMVALEQRIRTWIRGPEAFEETASERNLASPSADGEQSQPIERLSPLSFCLEIGKQLLSPGIRGLQLMRQFASLGSDYRTAFNDVLDNIVGQSRLSAYATIKRETVSLVDRIRRFGKRVGGGSLLTVYEVDIENDDGTLRHDVLKVLNPNARYHKDYSIELMRDAVQDLIHDDRFKPFAPLVDDLEEWIEGDILDQDFILDDVAFRERHNGFRPAEWAGRGYGYHVYIPMSYATGSLYVKDEEFVEGKSLIGLPDLRPSEQKEIVSLLARSYLQQIIGDSPFAPSTVWSDIQPGNGRLKPDRGVAYLDRNFYLKIQPADKLMLFNLQQSRSDPERTSRLLLDYLISQPKNSAVQATLTAERRIHVVEEAASLLRAAQTSMSSEEAILEALMVFRKEGLRVPLQITLLFKNLLSLNSLSQEAGFASLDEALHYIPGNSDGSNGHGPSSESPSPSSAPHAVLESA